MLTLTDQPGFELRPTAETAFEAVNLNPEVAFNKVEGVVKTLTLTQGGRSTTAERQ